MSQPLLRSRTLLSPVVAVLLLSAATLAADEKQVEAKATTSSKIGVADWQLNFGLGIEQFRSRYVDNASLQGNEKIVVVDKDYATLPSAWMTLNWNILTLHSAASNSQLATSRLGLFVGLKLIDAESQAFSAFSLGPQVSFYVGTRVISIGGGWVTHRTKSLADGILENRPLPTHFSDVTYREGTENSYMMMVSIQVF